MRTHLWRRWLSRAGAGLAVVAVALGAAVPARASVPDRFGFVLWNGAAVVPSGTFPAGSLVSMGPPGEYKVFLPGQGAKGGVVHVTAINPKPHWCQALKWGQSGADEILLVDCYVVGGVPDPTPFAVFFTSSSDNKFPGPDGYAYVDSDPSGLIISEFNSTGAPNGVGHGATGVWTVKLPGIGTTGPRDGGLQATAVGPKPARCKIGDWKSAPGGQLVRVLCFDATGLPYDTRFTLSYQFQRSLYGASFPPKNFGYLWNIPPTGPPSTNFNSLLGPGTNTATPAGTGLSLVVFKSIGVAPDDVQVTAFGPGSEFCGLLTAWAHSGGAALVRDVNCFDNAGVPTTTGFLISYNSAF